MGYPDPPGARSRRFPPAPQSAGSARRFVGTALDRVPPGLVDTAQLLVSELVTNVVLHARTEAQVSVGTLGGRVCVRVSDRRPSRGPVRRNMPAYAGPGQGLAMVEHLASRHGVDVGEVWKTVWFELWPNGLPPPSSGWDTSATPPPRGSHRTVTLVDMPGALHSASQQHRHTLLRELTLAASAGTRTGVRPEDLVTAHDMNNVISDCVAAAMARHPPRTDVYSLRLPLPADATSEVVTLRRVLDLAEEAAREERLLTLPALPRSRVFRQWQFDQIIGQLNGRPPTAWTLVPHDPGVSPSELAPWDAGQTRAGRTPTIAADDTNRIVAANGPAADMLGWNVDELVGRKLTTIIPEHLRERHIAAFTSLLLTGRSRIVGRSVPLPALHRDGRSVPVQLIIQTQETADGHTVFVAQLTPRATSSVHPASSPAEGGLPQEREASHPAPASEGDRRSSSGEPGMSALDRLSLLAATGSAVSDTTDLDKGLHDVGRILTQRLADWFVVDLFDDDNARMNRACVVHRAPPHGVHPETYEGELPPVSEAARGPLARVLRGAGPLLITETRPLSGAEDPLDARHLELYERLGATSAVVAPLRAGRKIFGAVTVARSRGDRPFTEEDLALLDDLVRTLALRVDNARLYQDTRNIAERLQRALLPELPHVGHLQLAARYAASSSTAQVGGDWYDCFVVPVGTALVIGDVTGHNLDAAIAMSQLRSMLRGIAIDRQEPPENVLRCLDLANHSLHQEATATCLYGLVKGPPQGPWELDFSSAGHLPPLLTTAEGETHYLDDGAGLLLGMDPDMPRPGASSGLPAHSTLLLYTDGLIERRDEPLDQAMDRLRRHTAALARAPLDVFCDELLIGLGPDSTDDLAILAVRPTPPV